MWVFLCIFVYMYVYISVYMYTFMNTLDKIKLLNDGPQVRNYLDAYSYLKGLKKQQQEDLTRIIHNNPNLVA